MFRCITMFMIGTALLCRCLPSLSGEIHRAVRVDPDGGPGQ